MERGLNPLDNQVCKCSAFQTLHVDVQLVIFLAVLMILHDIGVGSEFLLHGCFVLGIGVFSQVHHFDCKCATVIVLEPAPMVIPSLSCA